jgi:two-component system sensor histidine kinase KdpD
MLNIASTFRTLPWQLAADGPVAAVDRISPPAGGRTITPKDMPMVNDGLRSRLGTYRDRGDNAPRAVRGAAPYVAALIGVGLVTVVIAQVGLQLANASLAYIVVVLLAAVLVGRGPAIAAAFVAFLAFNYFLTEPRYTFAVADPGEWLSLLLFLAVAFISGQLAADQRQRAREAAEYERHTRVLYDVADAIAEPDLRRALQAVADRLRREIDADGLQIELGGHRVRSVADSSHGVVEALDRRTGRTEDVLGSSGSSPGAQRWMRVSLPQGGKRSASTFGLARVPISGPRGEAGVILVATQAGSRMTEDAGRLLASVSGQLWVALERSRLRDEATEAEVLRRSDDAKSALIDAVSHDLRTPLASIIAAAGSLRQRGVQWTEDEREGFAAAIEQEARRLDRIVGNLLDLGRIRAGAIHPATAWYELVALVREVAGRLEGLANERHQRLILDLPDELPPVALDYSMIDQVLTNLLENALKFSPSGTDVVVGASMTDESLSVRVDDAGAGLPESERQRVFDPFYRVRGAAAPGTGLGLAIASGLVRAHGGTISAEPRAGGGTRFTFTIPAEEAGPEP